jgi:hypothetical protein
MQGKFVQYKVSGRVRKFRHNSFFIDVCNKYINSHTLVELSQSLDSLCTESRFHSTLTVCQSSVLMLSSHLQIIQVTTFEEGSHQNYMCISYFFNTHWISSPAQLVYNISQLGYMFRPCGGHHQASTMYWNCRYIKDTLPTGFRVVYRCIYIEIALQDHVTKHNTPIHNILSTASQLSISQKALGTLPEDGNVMPRHRGATIHN